jgi:hypothetical protein
MDQVGQISLVLVEGPSQVGGLQLSGRTPHNRVVNFTASSQLVGEEIPVLITAAHAHSLQGMVCAEKDGSLQVVRREDHAGNEDIGSYHGSTDQHTHRGVERHQE